MLEGLAVVPGGNKLLPFVRHFYGSPSTYLWEDDSGKTHMIPQGEGGEQGDPLTPFLFSLGMHPALVAAQRRLRPSERIFAFLDVCVVCLFFCEGEGTLNQQSKPAHARAHHAHTKCHAARHGAKEEARPRHVLRAAPATTRHSSENLPPTSQTRTTSRARPSSPDNSGHRRSFLLRAATVAAPSTSALRA